MSLFTADLYRNFAIGFAVGAILVGFQATSHNWDVVAPALASVLPL